MLQADGCAGFGKLYGPARAKPGPVTEAACWPHTRRGFCDKWEHHESPTAKQARPNCHDLRSGSARWVFPLAERVELRRQTAPLVDEFFTWAEAATAKLSAKSSLAGAFRYTITRWYALSRFISDGRLEVDDNIAENAMRSISRVPSTSQSARRSSATTPTRRSITAANCSASSRIDIFSDRSAAARRGRGEGPSGRQSPQDAGSASTGPVPAAPQPSRPSPIHRIFQCRNQV